MPDNIEDMSNLQLWNTSRSIAGDALDVVLDSMGGHGVAPTKHDVKMEEATEAFEEEKAAHDYWPFESVDDLIQLVSEEANFERGREHIDSLTEAILSRLKDGSHVGTSKSTTQSPSSDTEPRQTERDNDTAEEKYHTTDQAKTTDSHNIQNNTRASPSTAESEPLAIAQDLYFSFLGDGETPLPEIKNQYDTDFPDRSVILTELMNTTGTTDERIRKIEQWVRDWYNDTEKVEQVNRYARSPMGKKRV